MKKIEVAAAIIVNNDKVFVTQRGYGDFKGKWEFPGGKIEGGETREEALVREIREELDTTISADEYLCTVEHDYPKFHLVMHCYICSVVRGTLVLLEHEAAKWLDWEHIRSADWLPADAIALEALERWHVNRQSDEK